MVFTPYGIWRTRADELMKQVPISRIRSLMDANPDTLIRLYSYQGQAAWDNAKKIGYWTGNRTHIEGPDHDWGDPYRWMRDRMGERVPNFSGDYPMWAWAKRPSTKPKPRKYRGTSENIRLTVLVPRSRIVFSDYDTWHNVLNRGPIFSTEEEWDRYYEEWDHRDRNDPGYDEAYMASMEPSWHQCLDFVPTTDPKKIYWGGSPKYFRVQACVDRFHWDEIVDVRFFDK